MIVLKDVEKQFDDLSVLKGISLEINDHEIYGIIGQSGAGKSTLLRCINGLEDYQSGTITVDGELIDNKDRKKISQQQKKMGMIFQNFNLLERLDVYDNVALPLKFWGQKTKTPEAKAKIEGLIKMVGLEDKIHSRPRELSGGQKQRVAIARALVLDPQILLCDEATSALDPGITKDILDLLQQINKQMGITIVVVTHQMEVVKQICEKVAYIKDGKVLAIGKPEELFIHPDENIKEFLQESTSLLPEEGVNIQLFFTDESSNEPVITEMARELNVDFSISWAKLEDFRNNIFGSLIITVQPEDQDKVTAFLDRKKVLWEVL